MDAVQHYFVRRFGLSDAELNEFDLIDDETRMKFRWLRRGQSDAARTRIAQLERDAIQKNLKSSIQS